MELIELLWPLILFVLVFVTACILAEAHMTVWCYLGCGFAVLVCAYATYIAVRTSYNQES